MPQPATPRETAANEAAKQAVGLAFAMAGAVLLILLQKKMGAIGLDDYVDPGGAGRRRMERAQRDAKRYDRLSTVLFRFGPARAFWWACDRADKARAAYEAERP